MGGGSALSFGGNNFLNLNNTRARFGKEQHVCIFYKENTSAFSATMAEPPPMVAWNSYAYVSASDFASDSTCICLGAR